MGLLTHKVERSEIASADHIYTWRTVFAYSHHGQSQSATLFTISIVRWFEYTMNGLDSQPYCLK
ncbi:hypothetical protein KY285_010016 [Solanum tuberosum]|nr:hypothetical protein KY285_010016 [Solanum tuberosum]